MEKGSPPFPRGQLAGYDHNDPSGATFSTSEDTQIEGMEWDFPDLDYAPSTYQGTLPARSNRTVKCRAVRNLGSAVLPKRCVEFSTAGTAVTDYGNKVNGYAEIGDAG